MTANKNRMDSMADIGVIGLAVMGENLVLNMESKGFTVAVYNRTISTVDAFINSKAKGKRIVGTHSLENLVNELTSPRKIMLMVKAGKPVDDTIEALLPLLSPGDLIIDGGNSHFEDTTRRLRQVESHGLLYVGTGVSGGEEGALTGPSIMPGGSMGAWPLIKDIFQKIAAQAVGGEPCCSWIGKGGAGHFVKMVHNGIEYGDMQLISEIYWVMKNLLGYEYHEMQSLFAQWNDSELNSYLIEITADILGFKDSDGTILLDHILDTAGQKGTGKWTSIEALHENIPLTLISEAVFARYISSQKNERVVAATFFSPVDDITISGRPSKLLLDEEADKDTTAGTILKQALYAAKIISYAQGFELLKKSSDNHGWELNLGDIALLWRGGCIIRSSFLDKINDAYTDNPTLQNLVLAPFFRDTLRGTEKSLRRVVSAAIMEGIPVPALSAALSWFDSYRSEKLPANLLQAQRDYFGAHMYERTDNPRGEFFHTDWTGHGGKTASTTYDA